MSKTLLEQHPDLVIEIANQYLDNMEIELGKKYKNKDHEVNAGLTIDQTITMRKKHNIEMESFSELYAAFNKMKPSEHMQQVLAAFGASGGNIDIEPFYDEMRQRLSVKVQYSIKDKKLDKIESLAEIDNLIMRVQAMMQIENVLGEPRPDGKAPF